MEKDQEALIARQLKEQREGGAKDIEDSSLKTTEESPKEEATEETQPQEPKAEEPQATEPTEEQPDKQEATDTPQQTEDTPSVEDWRESAKSQGWISPEEKDSYYNLGEDEYIQKLVELKNKGIDIQDPNFLLEQNVDYDSYDVENPNQALDLIIKDMSAKHPDTPEDRVKRLVEKEYKALFEPAPVQGELEDDDEFKQRVESYNTRKQEAEDAAYFGAKEAQQRLKERQESLRLPKQQSNQPTQEEIEAYQANIIKEAEESLSGLNEVKVKVGDKDYSLDTSDMLKGTKEEMLNNVIFENTYFSRYINDGKISYNDLAEDLLWANKANRETLINAAVNQALSVGEEKTAKALKNTELPSKPSAPQASSKPNLEGADLIAWQIAQQRRAKG